MSSRFTSLKFPISISNVGAKNLKKKKQKGKRKEGHSAEINGQGFDFGFLPRSIFMSDSDIALNDAFRSAEVVGCAYGYDRVDGFPAEVPCLTLLARDGGRLKDAFDVLADWGSQEDGDAVDVHILLREDGGYQLSIGANADRIVSRWAHRSLSDPIFFNMSWIKRMDSTNAMLAEWVNIINPPLCPVKIGGATTRMVRGIPDPASIELVSGLKAFVKLRLKVERERDCPDHWLIKLEKAGKRKSQSGMPPAKPSEVARARRRIIDAAFPVSRERIRRAGLVEKVRAIPGFETASVEQIMQSAINVALAKEIEDGQMHFRGIDDLNTKWWDHVNGRLERCQLENAYCNESVEAVVQQLELDTLQTLRLHGVPTSGLKASALQKIYLRLGYADA